MNPREFWTDDPAVDRIGKQIEKLVGATARDAVRAYIKESELFVEEDGKYDINATVYTFASDALAKKKFNLSKEIFDHADAATRDEAEKLVRKLRHLADRIEAKFR